MATKVVPCLICVFALLALFSRDALKVEMDGFAVKRQLCDAAERLGC